MSIKHIQAVLESGLPGNLKMVAITYADCADTDTGECWPCYTTVARRASISRRQAITNTQRLEEMGVLSTVGSKPTKQGSPVKLRSISLTRLTTVNLSEPLLTSKGEDITPLDRRVKSATSKGEVHDTLRVNPTSPRTINKPSKNHHGQNEFDLAFPVFWKAYPKKVKKQPARKAFEKAAKAWILLNKNEPDLQILLTPYIFADHLRTDIEKRIVLDRQWKPGSPFVPDPPTYLNQARWDDEIQEVTEHDKPKVVVPAPVPANDDRLLDMARENGISTYGMFRKDLVNAIREKLGA